MVGHSLAPRTPTMRRSQANSENTRLNQSVSEHGGNQVSIEVQDLSPARLESPTASSTPQQEKSVESDNASKTSTHDQTSSEDHKYGLTSPYGLSVLLTGTLLYGGLGTVARLSYGESNEAQYQKSAVLVVSELLKLVASIALLTREQGAFGHALQLISNQTMKQWLMFAVPASIYSITNVLDFYIVEQMDPGTMQVLLQLKIVTTALLWRAWFAKKISKQQWLALVLLLAGCMCAAFPRPESGDNSGEQQGAYILWPWGPIYVAMQVSLSALAGIYTEAVYKQGNIVGNGVDRSIHLDNLSMYFWGVVANTFQLWFSGGGLLTLTRGFNVYTWILVGIFASTGLVIAQVMKYFSNIIKLFMNGASVVVAGVLSFLVIGIPWTWLFAIGLVLVTASIYLYKTTRVWIR